jgi:hypothetical protein
MKRVCILLSIFVLSFASQSWYSYEDYRRLKRSVSWTPFTPEEHPLKHLSNEEIKELLLASKYRPVKGQPDLLAKPEEETKEEFHIPSFLLAAPTEYYVDQAFPKCIQSQLNYGVCSRSDIWGLTRTLQWTDCARNVRNVTYSAKNILQCDKNFGNSCQKPMSYLSLGYYSDDKKPQVGFVPDSCNPTKDLISGTATCLSPCNSKCSDGSDYKPIKINPIKTITNSNDIYTMLSQGSGLIMTFNANADIVNYKGGIYTAGGDLIFYGRVVGYKTYKDGRLDKIGAIVEMGFGPNWGENGNIVLSNLGRKTLYNLSTR